ncbi:helix-turn-helix transcriptional regulator [Acinetobacter sp. 194]|uniref:AraC family transcriptional regulator n=1 Tax=Acinetobacter shaoyimingii TaxID=2715164 RepID=UPI0014087697|nr:AraC family transcriptional regulator [Acinetobacter shaoyimingii]NHB57854.1 helix-turn-helix transcriptional regulator [Acinetobacter shaoyimingii]
MSIYIDSHKAVLKQVGDLFLDMYSPLPNHHLNHFNPSEGEGYSEIYDFGKLCVGKGKYWVDRPLKMSAESPTNAFGITILLSGTHHIKNHRTNHEYHIRSPMIILRKGSLGLQTIYLQENKEMSLITLDFNETFLEILESNFQHHELVKFFLSGSDSALKTITIPNKNVLHQAHYLLNLPSAQSSIDLLHLEGAALELMSLLLDNNTKPDEVPVSITKTIEILKTDFEQKITIRTLAKQVGINECDLKRLFKVYTGKTIGHYLLEIRMKHAQILLKEGVSIDNVTNQIGYSSAQYFRQVFERHFGYRC